MSIAVADIPGIRVNSGTVWHPLLVNVQAEGLGTFALALHRTWHARYEDFYPREARHYQGVE